MPKRKDLTNQKFGRLTAIKDVGKDKSGHRMWECVCDCGTTKVLSVCHLNSGAVRSCGCLLTERNVKYNKETKIKHGLRNSSIYAIWRGIKRRTAVNSTHNYKDYGGRGIFMHQEWYDSFESFYLWATSHGYQEGLSIDRIDNNGPYTPDNCRWVNEKTQANNRRNNRLVEFNGKTQTLSQWADELGIPRARIYKRAQSDLPPQELLYAGKLPTKRNKST